MIPIEFNEESLTPASPVNYVVASYPVDLEIGYRTTSQRNENRKGTTLNHPPTIRKSYGGRTIAVVGDVYRFLATGEETDGKYAMFEAIVPPGGGPPLHIHSREEESFYILEGEITFTVGEEKIVATEGAFANMPVGSLHCFKNTSDKLARMIISFAPAGLEKMFFELGVPLPEGSTEAMPPTKEEIDKLLEIAPEYGIEIKLPGH